MEAEMETSDYQTKLAGVCESVDHYTHILIGSMLYDLRVSMNAQILTAGKYARFGVCDDKIYDSYLRLIRNYKRSLSLCEKEEHVLVCPRLKNIIQGVESVIRARLGSCPEEITGDMAENPIFSKKKCIIHDEITNFEKTFHACANRFTAQQTDRCLQYARQLFITVKESDDMEDGLKLVGEIARCQNEIMGEDLISAFCNATLNCEEQLGSSGFREEILRYRELLETEHEILASVAKIEIPSDCECNYTEQLVAEGMLASVSETYKELERNISEIHAHLEIHDDVNAKTDHCSELWNDDMLLSVLIATHYDGFLFSLKSELKEVCHALERELGIVAEREASNKLYARAAYNYRKRVAKHELIAVEMLKVFESLKGLETSELLGEAADIAEGINETMRIKVESLLENKQVFVDQMARSIKELRKQQPKIILRELGELMPEIDFSTKAAFFETYRQKMQRHISNLQECSSKKCREFLKESLLFEIITFEEIMNYSVSRMRDDESTRDFVLRLDSAWDELRNILNKNAITSIMPEPHDLFNGHEHEILMAESNPDFSKGEIIKLMNVGYKHDGKVLIRANVIAAR